MTGPSLLAAAIIFWISWTLMPGVGITDASRILTLVAAQPNRVLFSSVLQLLSAALLALAIPGLARRFPPSRNPWAAAGAALLAVGACGDAADAIYHQVAYEMAAAGVDRAAMILPFQRMQTVDLRYLLPMIAAFFLGCVALSLGATREKLVPKWNPLLYALAVELAIISGPVASAFHTTSRTIGLGILGLWSASLAWVGLALCRNPAPASPPHP